MGKTIENLCKNLQTMSRREHDEMHGLRLPLFVCDFEICDGLVELRETIQEINKSGYNLVCVSQNEDAYTVFFQRFTNENP